MKQIPLRRLIGWLVVILSLLPLLDLLHPGLPVTHDGQDHVARIANFYQSLSEGNIVPRWAANLNWGYGHPILMFLYPLPSYVASLFHFIGFSFVDSTKLVFAAAFSVSMLAMYWWVLEAWGVWPAFAAAVLYGFAPYRFVDLYVRGAIGEHMAYVFLPVILWGLFTLSQKNSSRWAPYAVSLGTTLLILSHNALSIMFLPIAALYALYLGVLDGRVRIMFLLQSALYVGLGFLFSAFFWIPAYFEGKYTLRSIVMAGQFDNRFVPWSWFVYSPWNYGGTDTLSKSLGWAQLGVVAAAIVLWFRHRNMRVIVGGTLIVLLASLSIMTSVSLPLWTHINLLQKFQFPWRFLSVSVFATALLGGLITAMTGKKQALVAIGVCLVAMIGTVNMWHAHVYKILPQTFFTGIYRSTTDTGESSPIWSIRFMEHTPSSAMSVIEGHASIQNLARTTTKHVYHVTATQSARLLENTLYFPGWNILIDGTPVSLQFQDPTYRGLMTFHVPVGDHAVIAVFTDTKLRALSAGISVASFVLFIIVLGTIPLWRKKR